MAPLGRGVLGYSHQQELERIHGGKLVVKGIMRPDDAEKAVNLGVDGILVSNHGGRQLDARPPRSVFPAIDAAVGHRTTLMLDSGIRRSSDIITSLCVGAGIPFLGRAGLYGVSAGGLAGAQQVIDILRTELDLNMGRMGCPTVAHLTKDCLWTERDWVAPSSRGAQARDARYQLSASVREAFALPMAPSVMGCSQDEAEKKHHGDTEFAKSCSPKW